MVYRVNKVWPAQEERQATILGNIESMLRWADTAVCGIFFVDFLVLLRLARDKRKYLITGSLTAVITSLVLEPAKEANDPMLAKLEKIEAELAKLRTHLEES